MLECCLLWKLPDRSHIRGLHRLPAKPLPRRPSPDPIDTRMANAQFSAALPEDGVPIAPSAERWQSMTQEERSVFLETSLAALQHEASLMAEGRPHSTSKITALQVLRDFYDRIGRKIYLASELPVVYPSERVFAPDLMVVLDVEDTWQDDERMAWVVASEGRGLDLVMEILHAGNPAKDLMDNVLDYARMGIPEYFVYDRRKLRVLGYRLISPTAMRYEPIKAKGGRLASRVLGLDLSIIGGRLRFSNGGAELPETRELLGRVNAMVDDLEGRAEAAERQVEEANRRADAEAQRAEAEAQRADAAVQRADAAVQRADAEAAARLALEARLAALLARMGEG